MHLVLTDHWLLDKDKVNELLNRKMFQAGGGAVALGDFDIRDKRTGEVTTVRPRFINTPGFNPYKILYDDTLEKGPAVVYITAV